MGEHGLIGGSVRRRIILRGDNRVGRQGRLIGSGIGRKVGGVQGRRWIFKHRVQEKTSKRESEYSGRVRITVSSLIFLLDFPDLRIRNFKLPEICFLGLISQLQMEPS
jgi:hypothetical protein